MATLRILSSLAIVASAAGVYQRPNLAEYKESKAAKAAEVAATKADEKKMAAVDKIVQLLTGLKDKVLAEGEEEAQTYDKFSCWCKEISKEKTEAIATGTNKKDTLSADIKLAGTAREDLDTEIADYEKEIKTATKSMQVASTKRKETLSTYEKNAADLSAAVKALKSAIQALKASKPASFVQLQGISKVVEQSLLIADALGLAGGDAAKHAISSLLQASGSQEPQLEMENYKFKSEGIITTLESLLKDFVDEKNKVNADEVASVQAHEMFLQDKTNFIKGKKRQVEEAQGTKSKTVADIELKSGLLTTVAATLLDDQEYLQELVKECKAKAATWKQRSSVRADELTALTQAIAVIEEKVVTRTSSSTMRLAQQAIRVKLANVVAHNPKAMWAIEAEAEEADGDSAVGFLQRQRLSMHGARRSVPDPDGARVAVAAALKKEGTKLKSAMLSSLANAVTGIQGDVFAKVKTLIQNLIDKLLKDAASETDSKGYCDKALSEATQKREYAANDVAELNAQMAELAPLRDELTEAVATLSAEEAELTKAKKEAVEMRETEKKEHDAAIEEAKLGMEGVSEAIDILDKWYKTNAKNTLETGEAYKGSFADAGGIIGMLEVIKSDFKRTLTETEKAEEEAKQDLSEFLTSTEASLAEKKVAVSQSRSQIGDVDEEYSAAETALGSKQLVLETAIEDLITLQPKCINTGMGYDERVIFREDEIDSLKEALRILEGYKNYA